MYNRFDPDGKPITYRRGLVVSCYGAEAPLGRDFDNNHDLPESDGDCYRSLRTANMVAHDKLPPFKIPASATGRFLLFYVQKSLGASETLNKAFIS